MSKVLYPPTVFNGMSAGRVYWKNGCDCDWWQSAAEAWDAGKPDPPHLEYDCYWDENYDRSGKIIKDRRRNSVYHEWSINGRLIFFCPGCGKQLGCVGQPRVVTSGMGGVGKTICGCGIKIPKNGVLKITVRR